MDPMTQSAQISSSQGFADGQNSAVKEPKQSDKRVVLGSDKPSDGVATSLSFHSQPSEIKPPDDQLDSPMKTSPVSERIKALEALAAKKNQPDFRSDGSFAHFKDRHHDKSPTETPKSPIEKITQNVQIKEHSADVDVLDSPFKVIGDLKQEKENEETEEWIKAHSPPVPDFDAVDLIRGTLTSDTVMSKEEKETGIVTSDAPAAFACVPDLFLDSPVEVTALKDEFCDAQNQPVVEDESEFELSFLPTAYMWDQPEKSSVEPTSNLTSVLLASPPPPAGFGSPVCTDSKGKVLTDKKPTWTGELEPPEANEADSSGESDDMVIEDGVSVPLTSYGPFSGPLVLNDSTINNLAPLNLLTEEKETPPPKSERKLMQVPTINVIETDEPNYSDEEMEMELEAEEDEDYEVVKNLATGAPKTPELELEEGENKPQWSRPFESEVMEGYSPSSSPVNSDAEHSPEHKLPKSLSKTVPQKSASQHEVLPYNFSQVQSEKTQTPPPKDAPPPFIVTSEVDIPDNDEWSDEAQDIMVKPCKTDVTFIEPNLHTKSTVNEKRSTATQKPYMEGPLHSITSFMQGDTFGRQSIDYDCDDSSPLDDIDDAPNSAKEWVLSDPSQTTVETLNTSTAQNDVSEDINLENFTSVNDDEAFPKKVAQLSLTDYPQDPYSSFQSETHSSNAEQDFSNKMTTDIGNGECQSEQKINSMILPETETVHQESRDPDSSVSEPTDSFVDFMRECLKTRQDEEGDYAHDGPSKKEFSKISFPPSQSPPTMVMNLEQEQLTINALEELGSSQEEEGEEAVSLLSNVPGQDFNPIASSIRRSSFNSVPNTPWSQHNLVFDSASSKQLDAINEWLAEGYHLAEHVLTTILTNISVKDLIHWRNPKNSGLVFGLSMLLLLSLAAFSVISVASYLLLALLCVTITFRIYKSVVQAVQKSSEGHPFKALIDKDVSIPPETFRKHVDTSLTYINQALKQMSRLFLVEDLVDSLKLAVVMWLLTYVGAVFNGITILILADILLFAVPPIYEKNKTQIDQYIDLVHTQVNTTMTKLQEKLPGAVKRSKTE